MKDQNQDKTYKQGENRDPITGAPGSHPVGTGVGAAAGGAGGIGAGAAIGAATGTATGGPVGAAVGAVAGAIVGGAAGHAIAENMDPTREDAYWRENHAKEPYYRSDYKWQDYQGAYRTGYEGRGRLGSRNFDDVENELRKDYETKCANSRMRWNDARHAVRAAWDRVGSRSSQGRHLEQLVDSDVYDINDNKVGTLKCIWSDERGEAEFVGVHTGWLFGKTHVVPADAVQVGERSHRIRLPYTQDQIKDAPAFDADAELSDDAERQVLEYYGVSRRRMHGQQQTQTRPAGRTERHAGRSEQAEIPLAEEQLKVGKREVEAGGVRLRKIVRTEVVNQPVELKREEIVVERVPASEAGQTTPGATFNEQEIYIPLRREEAVVEKKERVREVVRARKSSQSDRQEVRENVRREDVEIESTGKAREAGGRGRERTERTPAEELAERENVPRSRRKP